MPDFTILFSDLRYCCHCPSCNHLLLPEPASLKQVERVAAWVAKYGHVLSSIQWHEKDNGVYRSASSPAHRTSAYAAIAAALQQAAATPYGLCLRSCKLANVSWDCHAILQQLASVSSLTSLDLSFKFARARDYDACEQQLAGVIRALPQLQQLRTLVLTINDRSSYQLQQVDILLEPLSGLTNLTSLDVDQLWDLR
jgi:hypothetical protein